MRITKKWLYVILAALAVALLLSLIVGCALFGGIDESANRVMLENYDTNGNGTIDPNEKAAMDAQIKSATTDNLPFPFNMLGGLGVGLATTAYTEYRRRKAMQALIQTTATFTADEVAAYLQPMNNATINKAVAVAAAKK